MIPLRDTEPSENYPIVNHAIIGVNVMVYLIWLAGADSSRFMYYYGLVPARYTVSHVAAYFSLKQQLLAFVTFMFLHGGFWHILSNMWFLYIFGNKIEDRLGPLRYLLFYLLCGAFSGIFYLIMNLRSNTPIVGASGAIAGVIGAYLILHPGAKILTLIPIIIIPVFLEIPAFFFIGVWLFFQLTNALGSSAHVSNIAWWAHIGGFIFGIIFLKFFNAFPDIGATKTLRKATTRKKTHRLQIIRPTSSASDPHLYGEIRISAYEAFTGAQKMVNIPWGFYNRMLRVTIPPGIGEKRKLRLKGQGKMMPDGVKGDLLLDVIIADK